MIDTLKIASNVAAVLALKVAVPIVVFRDPLLRQVRCGDRDIGHPQRRWPAAAAVRGTLPAAEPSPPGSPMRTSDRSVSHPCSARVGAPSRTTVYGPVCTVVWEGRSREAPPYPDLCQPADLRQS